ncbi:MgtC/SapB family protein [Halodesulfurarchaeum sp. HSR-GB]|uniref:MgtC/SapB family protein n=1 Tax=Halodesulfurarchaeum sp. HSR-GB TaxID=3074077 RepID=UPI00285737AD|nr:MgtC/SapB family protein [Halodesulfurarchaeum sp. HSR-GB]MDR5656975.1 MgtC/SapB family protein [Halodesulfurarchaeum sp. HSR-GB]
MPEPSLSLGLSVAVAFGIGAIIGMEREQSESGGAYAGSRTFPLFALYGALVSAFFPAGVPLALFTVALPLTVAYAAKIHIEGDMGLTTLVAGLVTVVLGAMTTHSDRAMIAAIVTAGIVVVLLSSKGWIHGIADNIGEAERRASVKFIVVVLVVLPLLPDRNLDVLLGLNPRYVWLMVVLVSGLSFAAYLLGETIGAKRGIVATGVLGGFVSSTATAMSMAERTREAPSLYHITAFSAVIASIVMFPRALVEVAVVNPALFPLVLVPLGGMTVAGAAIAAVVYWRSTAHQKIEADIQNPFHLRPALVFGAVFAVVLLVSEYANTWFGVSGIYGTAFVSGLADVDAITLSLSTLSANGEISDAVATTGIVIAAIANTLVKAGLTWVLGTRALGRLVTAILGTVAIVGVVLVLLL